MYNVISFCLYGSHATYIFGMKENISLGKKFYPDWQIRIYYNDTVPDKYIKEYEQEGALCIKCENIGKNKMNWEGMVWRFFPFDDEDVEFWISRDADSRLSKREADIVKQWTESDKTLHCIRDHRCHYNPIMGGMFGICNKKFHQRYKFKKISEHIKDIYALNGERQYNVDQIFLNSKIWSLLRNDVMSHISNNGRRINKSDIEITIAEEFIGKSYRLNDTITGKKDLLLVDLRNKTFKIKSVYNDYCLDCIDDKVKLKMISDSNSQLWIMDDKNRIIHCNSNKFLDLDTAKDLIITTNDKNIWIIKQGGFIENKINNLSIDIKGGLTDKRREIWLYKTNYSKAQQWEFVSVCYLE